MDVCAGLTGWSYLICVVVTGVVAGLSAGGVLQLGRVAKRAATGKLKEKE
jgi:hypothetical protein